MRIEAEITAHAISRYKERVKPTLEFEDARKELVALIQAVGEVASPPEWVGSLKGAKFIALSDGLGAVLAEDARVTTVIVRGAVNPCRRHEREKRRAKKREERRAKAQGAGGGRPTDGAADLDT